MSQYTDLLKIELQRRKEPWRFRPRQAWMEVGKVIGEAIKQRGNAQSTDQS